MNEAFNRVSDDVTVGEGVTIHAFANLYGCSLGAGTAVGAFVEIQKGVSVGERCKISTHSFICEGVVLEDEVFIGHHVCFTNDKYPRATTASGETQGEKDWAVIATTVKRRASVGSGAVILAGVTIGEEAIVGAGAVVTQDVPTRTIVAGNPARVLRQVRPT